MFAGALFTFEHIYMDTAATGSGSSSFEVFIRDHTKTTWFSSPGPGLQHAICWLTIWTSTWCHNPLPTAAERMTETSVLERCPDKLVAIFATLSFRQECHFPYYLRYFLQSYSVHFPFKFGYSWPSSTKVYFKTWMTGMCPYVWISENSVEHINLQDIQFYVSVPILKYSAYLGHHLSFPFCKCINRYRCQPSQPEGFKKPASPEGRGLAWGKRISYNAIARLNHLHWSPRWSV